MGTTPLFGWRYEDLPEDPDGQEMFKDLAEDVEATLLSTAVQSYTPVIASTGTPAYANTGTGAAEVGRYAVRNGWCDVVGFIRFGSTVGGGKGGLTVTLPLAPRTGISEQWIPARLYTPAYQGGVWWDGQLQAVPGLGVLTVPRFHLSETDIRTGQLQSADTGAAPAGSGIPALTGQYTIAGGGYLAFNGRYRVNP